MAPVEGVKNCKVSHNTNLVSITSNFYLLLLGQVDRVRDFHVRAKGADAASVWSVTLSRGFGNIVELGAWLIIEEVDTAWPTTINNRPIENKP